ncbi:MAG: cell division protein SepF [Clostridia bacterium]|nr:cell division protein SepF [Clostridia bacterium]
MAGKFAKFLKYIGIEEETDENEEGYYDEDEEAYGGYDDREEARGFEYDRNGRNRGQREERRDSRGRSDRDDYDRQNRATRQEQRDSIYSDGVEESFPNGQSDYRENGREAAERAMERTAGMKMVIYHPMSFDDTQKIIDSLRQGRPVVVNIQDVEVSNAMRILDFIYGGVYALDGSICRISDGVYVVAPSECDVVGEITHRGQA